MPAPLATWMLERAEEEAEEGVRCMAAAWRAMPTVWTRLRACHEGKRSRIPWLGVEVGVGSEAEGKPG